MGLAKLQASALAGCSAPGLAGLAELALGEVVSSNAAASAATAAAAAVAAFGISYSARPASFAASAWTSSAIPAATRPPPAPVAQLRTISSIFHPRNVAWVFGKNVAIHCLVRFNVYMAALLEHEKQQIEAEEEGLPAPPSPAMPDFSIPAKRGLVVGCRELSVAFVRRVYEHLLVWRVAGRAEPFLRDSVAWIRDVLAWKHVSAPVAQKLAAYSSATLHSSALFYAADCTVAIIMHSYKAVRDKSRSTQGKVVLIAKGVALHTVRCTLVLLLVSGGSALGSLARPGVGTKLGHYGLDYLGNTSIYRAANVLIKM